MSYVSVGTTVWLMAAAFLIDVEHIGIGRGRLGLDRTLDAVLDILGGDRLAVTPDGVLAQLEGPGQPILGNRPALGQFRLDCAGLVVEVGQAQEHLLDRRDRVEVLGQVRIERTWFGHCRELVP